MVDTHLRPAGIGDLRGIREVLKAAYLHHLRTLPDLPDLTDVSKADLAEHTTWVVVSNGRIVGVCLAQLAPPVAYLSNIAVHPDRTRQGIAHRLIDELIDAARRAGCHRIDLFTHPRMGANVAIYKRLGWVVTERTVQKVRMSRPV